MKVKLGRYLDKRDRRIDIDIDRFDTWGLDHTLALIIYPCLVQLKATKHGVPSEFADVGGADYEHQLSFEFYSETHKEAFDLGCARWDDVLDKMIWTFEQLLKDDYNDKYYYGTPDYAWQKSDTTFPNPITGKVENTFEMVDKNPTGHFTDIEGMRMHEDRIQEGLALFGKYYRSLWD
jgi:hypothetical protein